jgi:serine/threonine-protein kinase HipA
MNRKGWVFVKDHLAGLITEDEIGYHFLYEGEYLKQPKATPVSLTLPLRAEVFSSSTMLPFFDGLIPEGWLLDVAHKNWKLDPKDRMGLLLACCKDCIGDVSVTPAQEDVP